LAQLIPVELTFVWKNCRDRGCPGSRPKPKENWPKKCRPKKTAGSRHPKKRGSSETYCRARIRQPLYSLCGRDHLWA
jgi:hypothetical protein